jgi:hypothetical protein
LDDAFYTNCWSLQFAGHPTEYLSHPDFYSPYGVLHVPILAVLVRDPILAPHPPGERGLELDPQVSFCCQDSETGEILEGYRDARGAQFRPARADVAQAAGAILAKQGLKGPYKNERSGAVLILSDSLLQCDDERVAREVEAAWSSFLECARSFYKNPNYSGLHSAKWRLAPLDPGCIHAQTSLGKRVYLDPKPTAAVLGAHALVPGSTKNPYTLALSPAAGTLTKIRDEQGRLLIDIQTPTGKTITVSDLLGTCVNEATQVTQGQVLGLRYREAPKGNFNGHEER